MNKGGRPRDPVWIHFDEVSKDGKSYARCKKCCHELFSKVPFPTAYFSGVATAMSPTQWWRAVKGCGVDEKFSDFANNLLSCPASSASIERIFSNFAFVHTKVRNRLGVEKASNLVFCYRMLRGCNELDY